MISESTEDGHHTEAAVKEQQCVDIVYFNTILREKHLEEKCDA